jgi:hypothetical protein
LLGQRKVGGEVLFNKIGIWVWKAVWVWDRGWEAVAVFVGYGYHGMYVDMLDKERVWDGIWLEPNYKASGYVKDVGSST